MVSNRVSIRVKDGFGCEFSGLSVSIIWNYFLCTTLQLCINSRGPLKFTCPQVICKSVLRAYSQLITLGMIRVGFQYRSWRPPAKFRPPKWLTENVIILYRRWQIFKGSVSRFGPMEESGGYLDWRKLETVFILIYARHNRSWCIFCEFHVTPWQMPAKFLPLKWQINEMEFFWYWTLARSSFFQVTRISHLRNFDTIPYAPSTERHKWRPHVANSKGSVNL